MYACRIPILLALSIVIILPAPAEAQEKEKDPYHHLKCRFIGPAAGGRTSGSVGIPGNPLVYYVGSASGGVWKTTDAGNTWKPIFDDQPTASIGSVAVALSDPNIVYVGTGEANIRGNVSAGKGIFKSTDGGKSWKHVWKQDGQIGRIIIHPKDPDIVFAAVLGHVYGPNPERGIYRTTDGGKTWKQVLSKKIRIGNTDSKQIAVGAIDVCFDPSNPHILFASLWETQRYPWDLKSGGPGSGLYHSTDGGESWKELKGDGLPDGIWGRIGVAVAASDGRRVYALIEAEKGGLFRSDDGGKEWKLVNPGRYLRQRPWYFSTVHVDPTNADVVYCPNVHLLKSIDGGRSFKRMLKLHHVDHHDLWIDPKNPKRMIDSNDGGVDITVNGGETWFAPPLPLGQFYHISVNNQTPYRVLGNMQDLSTASGPSNSLASKGISLGDWHTTGGGETGFSMSDPSDPNIVYAGEYAGYITRYDHRTRQARNISKYPSNPSGHGAADMKYRFQWTAPILISPHNPKKVYHAANVLFATTDGGKSWKQISPDLTRDEKSKQQWAGGPITGDNTTAEFYCTIFAIAESPKKKDVLWAGSDDGLVHVSTDGGGTWTNVTKNIPNMSEWGTVGCIEASRWDAATAYVVVDAHRLDNHRPYLYKTSDYGKTWKSITSNLATDDYLHVVREDTKIPGMLYVGSESGVSFSRDGGKHWQRLKAELPTVAVSDLAVTDNDLVIGTNGRSIWIFDDVTPLRTLKTRQSVQLFEPHPAYRWRYHWDYTRETIVGKSPPKGAIINYFLPKKVEGEITMFIEDADGQTIRRFTSKKPDAKGPKETDPDAPWDIIEPQVLPKKIGVNRFVWDLRFEGAKIIPAARNDGGTPEIGPMVHPGRYTVKLTVDGNTLATAVDVKLDPRIALTAKVVRENTDFSLQIRDDITKISETVIRLQSIRKQVQAFQKRLAGRPKMTTVSAKAKKLIQSVDNLEAALHNPKAEVDYDVLAMKGGAKIYSQIATLYEWAKNSDGPVTQGMREMYQEYAGTLRSLTTRVEQEMRPALSEFLAEMKRLNIPHVVISNPRE